MSRMAIFFEDELRKTYPEFPLRKGVLSWEDNLPPFSDNLRKLVEQYDSSRTVLGGGALKPMPNFLETRSRNCSKPPAASF